MKKRESEKLSSLLKKEAQIKEQIKQIKQREKSEERKRDTRRKILIGGAILAKVKKGEWHINQLQEIVDSELKSDRDRELFDLPKIGN